MAAHRIARPRAASHGVPLPTSPAIPPPTTLSGAAQAYQTGGHYGTMPPPPKSRTPIFIGIAALAVIGGVIAIIATQGGGGDKKEPEVAVATGQTPETPDTPPEPAIVIDAAAAAEPVAIDAGAAAPETPPQPAIVDVKITSTPAGATLVRNGKTLGTTPYTGTLPQSGDTVTLVVKLSGYKDGKMVLRPDQAIDTSIKLEKKKGGRPGGGGGGDDRDQSVNPFGN